MDRMNLFSDAGAKSSKASSSLIQDENGIFCFRLNGQTYSLNINSKEEREKVKEEVNTITLAKYDWFKETTGDRHWVFYNTKMYEVKDSYLHYKESSDLAPVIPINATSCHAMFRDCSNLTQIDLSDFDTSNVTDMCFMFHNCERLKGIELNNFNTSNVTDMSSMFEYCKALAQYFLKRSRSAKIMH